MGVLVHQSPETPLVQALSLSSKLLPTLVERVRNQTTLSTKL
jgi:hypothetical protein